jgi:EAL domain-containing protein (putative c-di-GMP-specific phosphodiesterase class I)
VRCPECEEFDQLLFADNDLYFSFPLKHTQEKFSGYCARIKVAENMMGKSTSIVRVSDPTLGRFFTGLGGLLTEEEIAATKVLSCPANTVPGIEDFGRVVPLDRMIAAQQGAWIESIITKNSYKSLFQPMFGTDGQLLAVEALFRGIDDKGELIAPGYLFELAQRARMTFQADLAARRSAVTMAAAGHLQDLLLFINFNPTSIYDPAYCLRSTVSTITELGFTPSNIVFEVTETDRVTNLDHLRGILAFYRRSGFKIALDDVGAGYSGLNLLKDLQPDYMKIDMHLVRDIDIDPFRQSIVTHICAIAAENDIKIVAEGIETTQELAWLKRTGVDLLQGYLFSKPVEASAVRAAAARAAQAVA